MGRSLLRIASRVLQIALGIALLMYLGRYVLLRWQQVSEVGLELRISPLLASLIPLLLFYMLYGLTWRRLLLWMDENAYRFSEHTLLRIFFTTFLTRYLPAGTLWNVSGRIELYKRQGGSRATGFESVLVEQLYLIGGSIFLAALAVVFYPPEALPVFLRSNRLWMVLVGVGGCLLLLAVPDWILWLVARLLRKPHMASVGEHLTPARRLDIFARFIVANIAQGTAALLMLNAVLAPKQIQEAFLPVLIAAYPFSRFVGQVVTFLPGGIGIREGTFVFLLGPLLPVKPLLASAALMRLLSVLTELAILAVIVAIGRLRSPTSHEHT